MKNCLRLHVESSATYGIEIQPASLLAGSLASLSV